MRRELRRTQENVEEENEERVGRNEYMLRRIRGTQYRIRRGLRRMRRDL